MNVFLSYRTNDTLAFTDALCAFLRNELGYTVVKGGSQNVSGDGWRRALLTKIEECDVFIAIIGESWEDGKGTRNINDPRDVVRMEIAHALKVSYNKKIIPLLVNRARLSAKTLPRSIRGLADLQWSPFANETLDGHVDLAKLTESLRQFEYERQPRPVVLLSSTLAFLGDGESTEGLDYFATLLMTIVQKLKHRQHDVILKVPVYSGPQAAEGVAENQTSILREIVDNVSKYSGIIIAPFDTKALTEELVNFFKSKAGKSFPLATIDKTYKNGDQAFVRAHVSAPGGFECDGEYNGRLAAGSVIDYLRQSRIQRPNVIVLQGLEGSRERVVGFLKAIDSYNADHPHVHRIHVSVSLPMQFLAVEAKRKARAYMASRADWSKLNDKRYIKLIKTPVSRERSEVDVFFCCNDAMALGVCDWLEELTIKREAIVPTVVVGFDGIAAVRRKIIEGDPFLLNTIDVRVRDQVDRLVKVFSNAVSAHSSISRVQTVKGKLVDEEQARRVARILRLRRHGAKRGAIRTRVLQLRRSAGASG